MLNGYKADFLRILSTTGSVTLACRRVGKSRAVLYYHMSKRPKFASEVAEALRVYREYPRRGVYESAVGGPLVISIGKPVAEARKRTGKEK